MRRPEKPGDVDPLGRVTRRHLDVSQDKIWPLALDRLEQLVAVRGDGHDLDIRFGSE
ncbi:MAG TPA: hypothetical protein VGO00_11170 [Kofleriaceae bacterium]|nr:hypothetical protein [Kofleriaceae bacterium]